MESIGFKDINGNDLKVGQAVETFDSKGKRWVGKIAETGLIGVSPILKAGGIQYSFKSNYETWIHDQGYASTLQIINAIN